MINKNPGGNSAPICVFAREAVQHGIAMDFRRLTELAKADKMNLSDLQMALKVYFGVIHAFTRVHCAVSQGNWHQRKC
jgi:hypothetical protein